MPHRASKALVSWRSCHGAGQHPVAQPAADDVHPEKWGQRELPCEKCCQLVCDHWATASKGLSVSIRGAKNGTRCHRMLGVNFSLPSMKIQHR